MDKEKPLDIYRKMVAIRGFEEAAYDLYTKAKMPGWLTYISARRRWREF